MPAFSAKGSDIFLRSGADDLGEEAAKNVAESTGERLVATLEAHEVTDCTGTLRLLHLMVQQQQQIDTYSSIHDSSSRELF